MFKLPEIRTLAPPTSAVLTEKNLALWHIQARPRLPQSRTQKSLHGNFYRLPVPSIFWVDVYAHGSHAYPPRTRLLLYLNLRINLAF